ncbi:MAG: phenylacetate-CoA oxygenase subunit PaaC [Micromonosporaceae bacterium]|nr:phenylacetate-CoA oxygenase subunit PaaC [Micromonosporaceae bacterium]
MTTVEEVLGLGDDALVAAQRLAQWTARAHELEEDVALANIALDQLGAARLLLSYAGELEGAGRDEDALAYLRDDREFRNVLLVELPNGDFAVTVAKLLFLAAYQRDRYRQLAAGEDERLAGIAGKTVKESAYHLDHAALWTLRLGDGTAESHRRMQSAVDEIWPYTYELFEGNELRPGWLATVEPVLAEATLTRPDDGGWAPRGGREGRHTEHLSYLLAELQVLHRAHAGASW